VITHSVTVMTNNGGVETVNRRTCLRIEYFGYRGKCEGAAGVLVKWMYRCVCRKGHGGGGGLGVREWPDMV
jgi:hypothetical protein